MTRENNSGKQKIKISIKTKQKNLTQQNVTKFQYVKRYFFLSSMFGVVSPCL